MQPQRLCGVASFFVPFVATVGDRRSSASSFFLTVTFCSYYGPCTCFAFYVCVRVCQCVAVCVLAYASTNQNGVVTRPPKWWMPSFGVQLSSPPVAFYRRSRRRVRACVSVCVSVYVSVSACTHSHTVDEFSVSGVINFLPLPSPSVSFVLDSSMTG